LIAYVGTATAVCAGVTNYANVILRDRFGVEAFPWLLTAGVIMFACYLAYRDVQISTRIMLWLEGVSVSLISLVAVGIIVKHGWQLDIGQLTLQGVTAEKLRLGLVLAIFSSVGFESATSLGSEARNPLISIPRAVKWSAILAGLFFFLCAYAEVLAFRGEVQTLDKSVAPLHVLAQKAGLPPLVGTLTDLGAVLSFFSCFLACITAAARMLFLMGRNGALPAVLGHAHEKNQTPHRAVLLGSIAAFLPAGIMTLAGFSVFDIYGLVGTLATFGFLTAYILVSAAAPLYLRAQGRLTRQAIGISILAVLAMGAALLGSVYPVPPAPYSFLPYLYAVLLFGGFVCSMIGSARSPSFANGAPYTRPKKIVRRPASSPGSD
jgi:amino acid transporter